MLIGRAITKPLLIIAGTVLTTLLTGLGVTACQLLDARESLGSSETSLAQCHEDLRHENRQVLALADDLQTLTDGIAIERAAWETARLEAEQRARQRERAARAERETRAQIYADSPDCEERAATPVCAEIAERLVERRAGLIERWEGVDDDAN